MQINAAPSHRSILCDSYNVYTQFINALFDKLNSTIPFLALQED